MPAPKVFVSYAHESEPHAEWVRRLAVQVRLDGIEALLDRWELVPGDEIPRFMERSVRESDFILVVCTKTYKKRSTPESVREPVFMRLAAPGGAQRSPSEL